MNRLLSRCAVLIAMTAPLATVSAAPALADTPTCHGRPATIVATSGHVTGTPGDDVIVASGYGTRVDAGAGDDVVCLVGGQPDVGGGRGDDLVDATAIAAEGYPHAELGRGSDTYLGGEGHDFVDSGPGGGHDVISTAGGRDRVTVASAHVQVSLGAEHDYLVVTSGSVRGGRLDLGSGRDVVHVGARNQDVTLDLRHERLVAGRAHLRLVGAEAVAVTAYRARLVGTARGELLTSTACRATVHGGAGADRLTASGIVAGRGTRPCAHPSAQVLGGAGDDRLRGYRGRIALIGGPGSDHATGHDGDIACRAEHTVGCARRAG